MRLYTPAWICADPFQQIPEGISINDAKCDQLDFSGAFAVLDFDFPTGSPPGTIITPPRTHWMSVYQSHLLSNYGYWLIAVIVGLERIGVPFPAATMLIFVSAFAATHGMNINLIVAAASAAAIVGNVGGFLLGKTFGNWLLFRYGHRIGLDEPRIKLSQYLFLRYGIYLLVLGQFFPVLRELGGFLSGANRIQWKTFLVANAAGGLLWSATMGFGAYFIGKGAEHTGALLTPNPCRGGTPGSG